MATDTAVASRLIIAKQVTDDYTRTTPDHHYPTFVSESLALNQEHIPSQGLGLNYLTEPGFGVGNRQPGGDIAMELVPQSTGLIFEAAFGTVSEGGGGGPTYTHTFTPAAPLSAYSAQVVLVDSSDGTARPKDMIGGKVASLTVGANASGGGSLVTCRVSWLAHDLDTAQSAVTASWPATLNHWTSVQTSMTLAGSAYCVNDMTWTLTNPIVHDTKLCAARAGKPDVIESGGFRTVEVTVNGDFEDYTEHDYIAAGTEVALVQTISDGTNSLVTTFNVRTVGDTPMATGPERIKQPLRMIGTGATPISSVLTNSDATV